MATKVVITQLGLFVCIIIIIMNKTGQQLNEI